MPMSDSFRIHAYLTTIPELRTCIRNNVTEAKTVISETPQRDLVTHVSRSPEVRCTKTKGQEDAQGVMIHRRVDRSDLGNCRFHLS